MSAQAHNGFTAAAKVLKWLRAWHAENMPEAIDLDVVRQMLPTTPYGKGVREIKPPMALAIRGFGGTLCGPRGGVGGLTLTPQNNSEPQPMPTSRQPQRRSPV